MLRFCRCSTSSDSVYRESKAFEVHAGERLFELGNRAGAHAERLRDLPARFSLTDQVEDLTLARGQPVQRRIVERGTVAEAPPRNLRRDVQRSPSSTLRMALVSSSAVAPFGMKPCAPP